MHVYSFKVNQTSVDDKLSQVPAFYLTKPSTKFYVATSNDLGGDVF